MEGASKKHMNNRNNNQTSKNLNGHTEQKPTHEKTGENQETID